MNIDIPQPPAKLLVAGHLEAGDAFVLNGLIRVLARKHERIVWLTGTNNIRAVRETVADLSNVEVMASLSYEEVKRRWMPVWSPVLGLGYFDNKGVGFDESKWDREQYRQAEVDFNCRWTEFRLPGKLLMSNTPRRDIVLIHEKPEHGWIVKPEMLPSGLEHVRITPRGSILDWLPEVFAARELHFIDSAFLNLAESLYAMGYLRDTALCFHKYAKQYPGKAKWPELRAPWRVFE